MSRPNALALVQPEHTCHGCGRSCEAQLVGPLPDGRVDRLRALHAELAREHPRVADNPPFLLGRTPDGATLTFLNFPDKRCVFLDDAAGCLLHRHYGVDAKPNPCRKFPFIAIKAEDGVRLGRRPLCYRAHRDFDLATQSFVGMPGEVVADFLPDDIARTLDDPSPRAALRMPGAPPPALQEARVQERDILSWLLAEGMTLPECLHRLAGAAPQKEPRIQLPESFLEQLAARASEMAGAMGDLRVALAETGHGSAVRDLLDSLVAAGKHDDAPLPPAWTAFALEGLAQLVFLRETARFPSVAVGVLVFAMGPIVAGWHAQRAGTDLADPPADIPDSFGEPLAGWFRLMLQTNAFERLFPTPDALGELVDSLLKG